MDGNDWMLLVIGSSRVGRYGMVGVFQVCRSACRSFHLQLNMRICLQMRSCNHDSEIKDPFIPHSHFQHEVEVFLSVTANGVYCFEHCKTTTLEHGDHQIQQAIFVQRHPTSAVASDILVDAYNSARSQDSSSTPYKPPNLVTCHDPPIWSSDVVPHSVSGVGNSPSL